MRARASADIAHAFAAVGAKAVCVDVDVARAGRVAQETGGTSAECDITTEGTIDRVLEQVERDLDRITGLTNIVGLTRWKHLAESHRRRLTLAELGVVGQSLRTIRASVPSLRRAGGGTLTFVASVSAFTSAPSHGLYGMAKASLLSMVRTAAIEIGPLGIPCQRRVARRYAHASARQ